MLCTVPVCGKGPALKDPLRTRIPNVELLKVRMASFVLRRTFFLCSSWVPLLSHRSGNQSDS